MLFRQVPPRARGPQVAEKPSAAPTQEQFLRYIASISFCRELDSRYECRNCEKVNTSVYLSQARMRVRHNERAGRSVRPSCLGHGRYTDRETPLQKLTGLGTTSGALPFVGDGAEYR